jgi:hypothetical protein
MASAKSLPIPFGHMGEAFASEPGHWPISFGRIKKIANSPFGCRQYLPVLATIKHSWL